MMGAKLLTHAALFTALTLAQIAPQEGGGAELPAIEDAAPVAAEEPAKAQAPITKYRMSGARSLWPEEIYDDGNSVYITWPASQEIPAVFAINERGDEELVDGYMRNDVFIIDSIRGRWSFRIDKAQAVATREDRPQAAKAV